MESFKIVYKTAKEKIEKLKKENTYYSDPLIYFGLYAILNNTTDFGEIRELKIPEVFDLFNKHEKTLAGELLLCSKTYEEKNDIIKEFIIKNYKKHDKPKDKEIYYQDKPVYTEIYMINPKKELVKPKELKIQKIFDLFDEQEKIFVGRLLIYPNYYKTKSNEEKQNYINEALVFCDFMWDNPALYRFSIDNLSKLDKVFGICALPSLIIWGKDNTTWRKFYSVDGEPKIMSLSCC